ncbi:MAG: pilus assembly protein PilM, partial [Thermodesulfovibrionales bacterium]
MKTLAGLRALSTQFSPFWERLRQAGGKAGKVLFFSLGDEAISPRRSLCVSLEKGGFSAVCGRRVLSRVSVSGSRAFPFQGYPDPADFASSLDLAAKEMGVSGVAVSIALPKAWTVIKTFNLPHSVKQNLPEVLSYEMDRITPFSSDEALYDFEILKETEEGMHIVVVAAKAEMVLPYLEALAERGFQVERVTSTVSGAGNLCLRSGWKDCIFLEISGGEYSGVVYADGMITASFSRSLAGDDAAKGDLLVSELETRNQGLGKETKILVSVREQSNAVIERLRGLRGVMFVKSSDFGFGSSAADASLSSLGCLVESLWPKAMSLNLLMKGYREKKRPAFSSRGT